MTEELGRKLAELAARLGTTVEHLWSVLIRQAYIDGISSLITVLITVAFGLGLIFLFQYVRNKHKEALEKYVPTGLEFVVLGMVLVVVAGIAGNNLYWVISDFFNPEYYALRQLPGWRN
jgi:formate hydrogenlyase subunit 3/multisubunit Na+/H+ antiporter MnhD subunit